MYNNDNYLRRMALLRMQMLLQQDDLNNAVAIQHLQRRREQRRQRERPPPRDRTIWVQPWLRRRSQHGFFGNLINELQTEDVAGYRNFMRFDPDFFNDILRRVGPHIERQKNNFFCTQKLATGFNKVLTGVPTL